MSEVKLRIVLKETRVQNSFPLHTSPRSHTTYHCSLRCAFRGLAFLRAGVVRDKPLRCSSRLGCLLSCKRLEVCAHFAEQDGVGQRVCSFCIKLVQHEIPEFADIMSVELRQSAVDTFLPRWASSALGEGCGGTSE
jgi:hypothetical protein